MKSQIKNLSEYISDEKLVEIINRHWHMPSPEAIGDLVFKYKDTYGVSEKALWETVDKIVLDMNMKIINEIKQEIEGGNYESSS